VSAEIVSLRAPVADAALEQLADVLVDCVEGGASVSFMSPFPHDQALVFFRKVANSVAAGDTVLLAAKLNGRIVGTVQLGLDTPPNQPHRADVKKMLVHRSARGNGIGAALMAEVEEEARRHGRWLLVLDTVPGENGHRLYLRAGWTQTGPGWCRTTRCFRMAVCATPPSCGSGWRSRRLFVVRSP
jgi:GNAT superfamily N-acetyltransferase